MSQYHTVNNDLQDPTFERVIRLSLRAMGLSALTACILFWVSLLVR